MINVDESILFYAFRYALGRTSYAAHEVIDEITINMNNISSETKNLIIKEIEDAERNDKLGMIADRKRWLKLKKILSINK